ncbi:MAG: ketol-acid reductoisomerase [Fimbriimonadales bacterium]|nr:ketol-acid reductoisomerase [Fimbriimonadales bacterium]
MGVVLRDEDLTIDPIRGKTVAVLGFGSQGSAQAMNLRDSGIDVIVGVRMGGPSELSARKHRFEVFELARAVSEADLIALLLPEKAHAEVIEQVIDPHAKEGVAVVFAHGYTVVFGDRKPRPDLQRILVAPKAIGPQLRKLYEVGSGAAALIAADPGDIELAKAYAKALGCGRRAVIESSFREETETDLFGEQAVLCGGIPSLAIAAFETLVDAGYSPEAAYFECLFEIKLIADMMFEYGIAGMVDRISDTAQFGAMQAGPRIVNEAVRLSMRDLLVKIQTGKFAQENRQGDTSEWREALRSHLIERVRLDLERKV